MNEKIETIRKTRAFLLSLVAELTIDELNEIPQGFNNNIAWNLAHVVAAQQGLCYVRAGLQPWVNEGFVSAYRPGSKPEKKITIEELEEIKTLMSTSLDQLESDLQKGLWTQYPAWTTRYGNELASIDDAVTFLLFHEGLHVGYVMALKRVVKTASVAL